jgi:PAS domain S-box-containing protein
LGEGAVATFSVVPYFICPNCKERSIDHDRKEGLSQEAVACHRCGFGFLFELMDDYYPAPGTGFVVCDQQGRILASGRGIFELTGYREDELMGREVMESLALTGYEDGRNPAVLSLEWGVRRLGEHLQLRTRAGKEKAITADFFPAYDEDGGLLVALTPRS